jgi:DNA repair exonuclease SbcCD ATPase subunit
MPDNIEVHIKNLYSKLQLLLKKHALLQKENEQLKKENERSQRREKELNEEREHLEMQLNILKTSTGKLEGKEKSDFEKSINQYIRSIDKCITMLNK